MNKILVLLSLFIISCVGDKETSPGMVREVRRFEPLSVTFEDNERIQAICRALSAKEDLLSVITSSGLEYHFSYSQKGCSDNSLGTPKSVVTTIQRSDFGHIFKPKNNEEFGFPDVETFSKGVMAEICQSSGSLVNPIQTSRTGALWFTTFTSSASCQPDPNVICIHLQRGSVVDNLNYKIHTNEWIKFKISKDKEGFFIERKLISSASCPDQGTIEKRATLK